MDRGTFLRRSSLILAGGLLVGDEALEAFAKLTHVRKSFPSAGIGISSYHWDSGIAINGPVRGPWWAVTWGEDGPHSIFPPTRRWFTLTDAPKRLFA